MDRELQRAYGTRFVAPGGSLSDVLIEREKSK